MNLNDLINFLISPSLTSGLKILKAIFLSFTLVFSGFIIWVSLKSTFLKRLFIWDIIEVLTSRAFKLGEYAKKWKKIKSRLEKKSEAEAKLAILEADSLFDEILEKGGYLGEDLEEKLKKLTPASLPNLKEVYQAHQIRDNIVRDPTYKLDLKEAEKNLRIYEKSLTYLEAL